MIIKIQSDYDKEKEVHDYIRAFDCKEFSIKGAADTHMTVFIGMMGIDLVSGDEVYIMENGKTVDRYGLD